jgi:hypothetical protein
MPTIEQAIDFLRRNEALGEPKDSPWRTLAEGEQRSPLDWDVLFPKGNQEDPWGGFNPPSEELEELYKAIGEGAPVRVSRTDSFPAIWDTCAWYQPIHFFGHDWGIYIKESCVKHSARTIARFLHPQDVQHMRPADLCKALYRAALLTFYLHEAFHHKVESLGFRLHVAHRASRYLPYEKDVYQKTAGTDDQLEEALANADSYLRLGENTYSYWLTQPVLEATRRYLEWEFPNSPPGYRMAVNYLSKPKFGAGENFLQSQMNEASLNPAQPTDDWDLAPRMTQSLFRFDQNIYTVIPAGTLSTLPII